MRVNRVFLLFLAWISLEWLIFGRWIPTSPTSRRGLYENRKTNEGGCKTSKYNEHCLNPRPVIPATQSTGSAPAYNSSFPFFFRHLSISPPPTHTFSPLRLLPLVFCIFTMPGLNIEAELGVLTLLTQESPFPKEQQQSKKIKRRDTELDPLILAAAFSSGPHVTRHHHSHDFFPAVGDPRAEGAWDWTKWTGEDASSVKHDPKRRSYNSQQAPRRQRLKALGFPVDPEPQVQIVTSPTELKSPSLHAQSRSPRPSISNGTATDERACFVYTIK